VIHTSARGAEPGPIADRLHTVFASTGLPAPVSDPGPARSGCRRPASLRSRRASLRGELRPAPLSGPKQFAACLRRLDSSLASSPVASSHSSGVDLARSRPIRLRSSSSQRFPPRHRQWSSAFPVVVWAWLTLSLRSSAGLFGGATGGATVPRGGATGGATLQQRLRTSTHFGEQSPWSGACVSDFGASERTAENSNVELGGIEPPSLSR